MKKLLFISVFLSFNLIILQSFNLFAQNPKFNGISTGLNDLYRVSDAKTRSISPESPTGEKGKGGMQTLDKGTARKAARELGQGWKVNPYVRIGADSTYVLADITGPGAIQQMWFTPTGTWRYSIIRIYWDNETTPSVEVPIGDFFVQGWGEYHPIVSLPICVNPGSAFNSYWVMPFKKHCKITLTNVDVKKMTVYYQINYTLTDIPDDAAYFHAQFRRTNPLPYKTDFTIIDDIKGKGQYVGTIMNWGAHNNDWWGEGEIKFFMDGDKQFPTICGTGTEDYFCGSYCFITNPDPNNKTLSTGKYTDYTTPYAGFYSVKNNYNVDVIQPRYGLYRFHVTDPIRFEKDLKVTMQSLGWRSEGRYLPLMDDISSVAIWYQTEPHNAFPKMLNKDGLEND
jgi:hypothetical protein